MSLTWYKSPSFQSIPSLRLPALIVPEKSLTKNLTLTYMERKKNERTNEQISSYTIQVIVIALNIKFEASRLAYMERKKNERTNEQIS